MCDRLLALLLLVAVVSSVAAAGPPTPASRRGARPLSEILGNLNANYAAVSEASFEGGMWEIEAERDEQSVEIRVDPDSGVIVSERPDGPHMTVPPDALPLAKVVKQLEEAGCGLIREVDLRGTVWEVEILRNGRPRELTVDVRTGKILTDRDDD